MMRGPLNREPLKVPMKIAGKPMFFSMASKNVRKLCGARFYCNLKQRNAVVQSRNSIASRNTGVILALAMYS